MFRSGSRSVSGRFLLIVVPLVGTVAFVTFGFLLYERFNRDNEDRRHGAEALTVAYAGALRVSAWDLDTGTIDSTLQSLGGFPAVKCAIVRSPEIAKPIDWHQEACNLDAPGSFLVTRPISHDDQAIADLTIYFDNGPMWAEISRSIGESLLLTGLIMAAMIAAAQIALRWAVSRPVQALTADMLTLSRGETDIRIIGQEREDEIGAMARALAVFRDDRLKAEQMAKDLEIAQDELIEQAKLASLGGIVAGVAHEVNTPIGICVTAITKLSDAESELSALLKDNRLTESGFNNFLRVTREACKIATTNLQRAAQLIRSFKGIAVDQASEEARRIELGSYVDEALTSLRPELRKRGLTIELECPDRIEIETIPSAIWQIISNLVLNAQVHAFDAGMIGSVRVRVWAEGNHAHIAVSDNGKGMKEEVRARIFEPFFTTRRGSGGSGLGLTIVYNLVTQTLGGRITCKSKLNRGTEFAIRFPFRSSDRVDRRSNDPLQSGVSKASSAA